MIAPQKVSSRPAFLREHEQRALVEALWSAGSRIDWDDADAMERYRTINNLLDLVLEGNTIVTIPEREGDD